MNKKQQRGPGRPSLTGAPGKSPVVSVRVTPEQYAAWEAMQDPRQVLRRWLARRARADRPRAPPAVQLGQREIEMPADD